jgi:hypothetical protein
MRSTNAPRAFDIIQLVSSYLNEQPGVRRKDTNDFIHCVACERTAHFFSIDLLFLVHGWLLVVKHFTPAHKEAQCDLKQTAILFDFGPLKMLEQRTIIFFGSDKKEHIAA